MEIPVEKNMIQPTWFTAWKNYTIIIMQNVLGDARDKALELPSTTPFYTLSRKSNLTIPEHVRNVEHGLLSSSNAGIKRSQLGLIG